MRTTWALPVCLAVAAPLSGACGLSNVGLGPGDDGGASGLDATADTTSTEGAAGSDAAAPADAASDTAPSDASTLDAAAAPDSMQATDGAAPCANKSTSCGSPGKCVDCTTSSFGAACVNDACGCMGPADCPAFSACQPNHLCATACAGPGQCHGGCCSGLTCVAFDNGHCGGACAPCGGATPTCGAGGTCTGACGGAGDGTCQTSCCNAGTCAPEGDHACGDFGAACVNCAAATSGTKCELIALHYVCGCDGPASANQCAPGLACRNQQCGAACDGQHPCNGGCCSGNDATQSTCVAACPGGGTCKGNYCQ